MFRPQTLAEVAKRATKAPPEFHTSLNEFADEFYLDHPDKAAQQWRIDAIPEPVGEPLIDAIIGAVGEHLAQRWGLRVPDWTQRPQHFALHEPRFLPDSKALRGVLIVESPPAFRSRLLFTGVEPLDRFPHGVARARVPLDWPSRTGSLFGAHRGSARMAENVDLIGPALDVGPDAETGQEVER
jgi:hypothetical protein